MAPVWGEITATLDWCEKNYEVTWSIAEFWNTLSSLAMVIFPIMGIRKAQREGLESRFKVINLFFMAVGIGSLLFHATMRWSMQLLDEIPMVWGTSYMVYMIHLAMKPPNEKCYGFGACCFLYSLTYTFVYLFIRNPLIFLTMYGVLTTFMIYQTAALLFKQYSKEDEFPEAASQSEPWLDLRCNRQGLVRCSQLQE